MRKTDLLSLLLVLPTLLFQAEASQPDSLEQIFHHAMQDMNAGSYGRAEDEFRQILRKDPNNPSALINLGVLYVKTLRYTEAVDAYTKALRVVPGQQAVQLDLGLAYLKQEKYADALTYFERLHASHAGDMQVTTLLATCLTYTGKPEAAIELLRPLTEDDSNRGALYVLGLAYTRAEKPQEAMEALRRVFAGAPESERGFLMGEALLEATDYAGAAQSFQSTLATDAGFAGAHRELGRAYLGMHQNDRAEEELRAAIKADANDASALYSLGALLVQLSKWREGRTVLEQAQRVAPDSWATAFYLGKADFELHDAQAAEKQLRRAAELNPDEPGAPYLLARVLRAQGHAAEADIFMQRVAALHASALDAEKKAIESANRQKSQPQDRTP